MVYRTKEALMVRLRLASVAMAASLGLVCGCLTLPPCPLLGRLRCRPAPAGECCEAGAAPACEGPMLDPGPAFVPPLGSPGAMVNPSLAPQNGVPSLAPAPRLVPQPQAQAIPYTP